MTILDGYRDSNSDPSVVQPVRSRCTNYATGGGSFFFFFPKMPYSKQRNVRRNLISPQVFLEKEASGKGAKQLVSSTRQHGSFMVKNYLAVNNVTALEHLSYSQDSELPTFYATKKGSERTTICERRGSYCKID
jgi:hypothetical protein